MNKTITLEPGQVRMLKASVASRLLYLEDRMSKSRNADMRRCFQHEIDTLQKLYGELTCRSIWTGSWEEIA